MNKRTYGGRIELQCERCGHQFTRPASRVKDHAFCSRKCYFESGIPTQNAIKATRTRFPGGGLTSVTCTHCGNQIERYRSQSSAQQPFCSKECKRLYALSGVVRQITSSGYVKVYVGKGAPGANASGHIPEHRKVIQDALGRALTADENVHHKNGVRADNRFENLELWSRSQPSGQRVEDKLAWAREFIRLYEGLPPTT